jgi:carboxymethylenebutenolidase
MSIRTEKVQIPVAGAEKPMPVYVAIPEGAGPFPAVMVIEEIFGINGHIRDITERVAREGYLAVAPDVHHRAAPAPWWELDYDADGMKKGMELIPKLSLDGINADLKATLAFLRERKDVRGDRIGCMGFCIGGHVAYLAACTTDVKATASFYGGGVAAFSPGGGPPTVTKSGGIKGKILCFFGNKDPMIPPAQVETIKAELEKHHIRHEVVVYDGASHAFMCDVPKRGSFNKPAHDDAWTRTVKLFGDELKK